MLLSRLFSSTKASGQTSAINSSLLTRRPPRRTSAANVSNAFSVSGTRSPARVSKRSDASSRNGPNSYKCLSCFDMAAFRKEAETIQDCRRTPGHRQGSVSTASRSGGILTQNYKTRRPDHAKDQIENYQHPDFGDRDGGARHATSRRPSRFL